MRIAINELKNVKFKIVSTDYDKIGFSTTRDQIAAEEMMDLNIKLLKMADPQSKMYRDIDERLRHLENKSETVKAYYYAVGDDSEGPFSLAEMRNMYEEGIINDETYICRLSKNEDDLIGCTASNNGYEKIFGCIHKREVYIDKRNNLLKGTDHIFKARDGYPIRYAFRFHINPELNVVKTMSGNAALIQISKNKSLLFSISDENLEIEKSIFLGEKKIIDGTCITISGNLVNKNKIFNWEIKKNI